MNKIKIPLLSLFIFLFNCNKLFPEDNEGPTISILKPFNFEKVNESVEILPVSPNYDIPKVDILISKVESNLISNDSLLYLFNNEIDFNEYINIYDNRKLGTDNNGKPLLFFWNTTTKNEDECCLDFPDSSIWFLTVKGYDSNDNKTESDGIFVMVDNSLSNPNSIYINSISLNENGFFSINWDRCEEDDFLSYSLNKSYDENMLEIDTIYQTFNIDDTSYVDSLINPLIFQYYSITVLDTFGYSKTSQVFTSTLDQFPDSIEIQSITYNYNEMEVVWEKSSDSDFKEVKLLYSNTEVNDKDTLFTSSNLYDTTFTILDFDPTIENWFWIMSIDTFYQETLGPGLTNDLNLPPNQKNITSINFIPSSNNFSIVWEKNNEYDFNSYKLFESFDSDMSIEYLIVSIYDSSTTNYLINNVDYGELRYYKIVVEDGWNQETASDIYEGNSNYWFNEKYDFYQTNDNLFSVVNLCGLDQDQCKYVISGQTIPSGDTRSEIWVSVVDSLGEMNQSNELIYYYNNTGESDQINSMIKTNDNHYVLNATIGSNSSTVYDVKLIKINHSDLTFLDQITPCESDLDFECGINKNYSKSLMELNDNSGFLLTGYTIYNNDPNSFLWIIKTDYNQTLNSFYYKAENFTDLDLDDEYDDGEQFIDSNGDGVWNDHIYNTRGYDIIQDGDNYVVVGTKYYTNNGDKNLIIYKFNNSLDSIIWKFESDFSGDDEAISIINGLNNDYIVTGYKTSSFRGDKDIFVLKINSEDGSYDEVNGDWNGAGDEVANKVISTLDNSFVLVGYTTSYGSGNKDVYLVKFNDSGIVWKKNYGCEFDDIGNDVKETLEGNQGGFIIGASTENNNDDAWFIKTNHNGETNQIICD